MARLVKKIMDKVFRNEKSAVIRKSIGFTTNKMKTQILLRKRQFNKVELRENRASEWAYEQTYKNLFTYIKSHQTEGTDNSYMFSKSCRK